MGFVRRALGLELLSLDPMNDEPIGDHSADVTPPVGARSADVVTVERALTLPAVYRAIQIIAGMAAQLQLISIKAGATLDPLPSLVTQPDPWRSLSSFLERVVVGMATDGNAFLLKHRGPIGQVLAVEALDPRLVFPETRKVNGVKLKQYRVVGRAEPYQDRDIEHIWMLEVPGMTRGLGPIAACARALGGALDVREYSDAWFKNPDVPSGVLTSDQVLNKPAVEDYKKSWYAEEDIEGVPKYGPKLRVLGHGLSYSPIALKPAEAQWLESSGASVLDVARMFGLPGDYLMAAVEGSSLTYSNLEMIDAQFLRTTLFPVYLRKIEAAMTNILPNGQTAKFLTEALLRPDAKTRAEIDATYIENGVYDAQYVRDRDGIDVQGRRIEAPAPKLKPIGVPA